MYFANYGDLICHQAYVTTDNESLTALSSNFDPLFFADCFFNSATFGEGGSE